MLGCLNTIASYPGGSTAFKTCAQDIVITSIKLLRSSSIPTLHGHDSHGIRKELHCAIKEMLVTMANIDSDAVWYSCCTLLPNTFRTVLSEMMSKAMNSRIEVSAFESVLPNGESEIRSDVANVAISVLQKLQH